jgi:hypothetical protein
MIELTNELTWTELSNQSQSWSHIATDGQSVSLGFEPHLELMTRYLLLFDSYGLVFVLSDKRKGLFFVYVAGPCQRSLSRVRVPWDTRSYFSVSGLRRPISSPPMTRRITVEVFDPASTRETLQSITCPHFITLRRPEYRSSSQTVPLLFSAYQLLRNMH